jgi:hypothetical protein
MTRRIRLLAVAALLAMGCGGAKAPPEASSGLTGILPPASELAGWTVVEGPVEYGSETLFEYLNGGAERYLANGFAEVVHIRYQLGADPAACVTLDVYDMGSDLGAFGIYSAARRPEYAPREWGSDGYRNGAIAAAWKASTFVHAEADDERPELIEQLERLVAGVCERAPGEASAPAVLDPLPTEGRVARSERYVPANLLGHSFLPGGVLATYELDGQRADLYLSDLGSDSAAAAALDRLRTHLAEWGSVEPNMLPLAEDGFRYRDPTIGDGTVIRIGGSIAGIHGDLEPAARERILQALVDSLSS